MLKWLTISVFIVLLISFGSVALEEQLTFEVNGIQHYESRTVTDHIVTLTDVQDQFIVTLDYGRGIALINNLKNQLCYFTALENFPISEDDKVPVLVVEGKWESQLYEQEVILNPVGVIPSNYVHLTNDINVSEQCVSKPSYWLEMKDGARKRRGYSCDSSCWLLVCVDVDIDVDINWPWK